MKFSIVVPLHNEELNIADLYNEIILYLKKTNYTYQIILVDDSSDDNTLNIINKLRDNNKNLIDTSILHNNKNIGQSLSLVKGIKSSKYNTIVTLDGDGQNNPKDILNLVSIYEAEKSLNLIGGLRLKRSDNFIKKYSSKIANFVRMNILNDDCRDTGCSLKVFDKNIFLKFPIFDGMHRFLPALFKGFGGKTKFIEVDHRKRIYGISKYGTIDRLFRGIKHMYMVKKIIKKNNIFHD